MEVVLPYKTLNNLSMISLLIALAGNVIFPGLMSHAIDVIETSPVYQTCRVQKDHGGANYTYHWLGPDGRKISDNNELKIDYALRSIHSGAYTCVAKSSEAAHRDLEGTIYVIVSRKFNNLSSLPSLRLQYLDSFSHF